jgi:hypothetical protein
MKLYRIIIASHNEGILTDNVMTSPIVKVYPVQVMRGYINVPQAYNEAQWADKTIFVHHDVVMPPGFEAQILLAIDSLPDTWAVCGVAGVRYTTGKITFGYIEDRGRKWGKRIDKPVPVQTLDELLLIVNRKHGLVFDTRFPQDFYGADICMQAHARKLGVYCIPGFVKHNSTRKVGERTPSFYESEEKFKLKWKERPIATTCSVILE